jgi:predicted  nucleic acid-binding Zn-ribbon protein
MSNARLLYRLQHIEQELEAKRQSVAALLAQQSESAELVAARTAHAEAQAHASAALAEQKEREYELQRVVDKLTAAQEQLYSGRVKNPKELASLETEVKGYIRRRDQLQDGVLEAMIEVEAARESLRGADGALAEADAASKDTQQRLGGELTGATASVAQLERDLAEMEKRLDAKELEIYRDLRRRKGTAPVARLRGGTCGRCGVSVPVVMAAQVRHAEEFVFCPSCGRLLVDA